MQPLAALLVADVAARTNTSSAATATAGGSPAPVVSLAVRPGCGVHSAANVTRDSVTLSGNTKEGLLDAMTTFIQALELSGDTDTGRQPLATFRPSFNCSTAPRWRAPVMVVTDSPELPFRGMLSDVARKPVSLLELKKLVVMCRFYKLNHLHLHMSDNEAVVFPSTAFPQLGKSGWQKTMTRPQYSLADLRELQDFAALRGVTLIGELDLPGHGTGFTCAAPDLFAFPSSRNTSCEPNQITNFLDPATVKRFQTLMDEVAAVFPGPIMHTGGDELQWWRIDNLTEVASALTATGLASDRDLYRRFIEEMRQFAAKRNKTLHVWEGFGPKRGQAGHEPTATTGWSPASTVTIHQESLVIEAFGGTNYNPRSLVEDGYTVINTMTTPLYVDQPTSPELIWQWNPWLFGDLTYANESPGWESWWEIPEGGRERVQGVMTAAWDMPGSAQIQRMRLNMPAFSDRSWHPDGARNYADLAFRAAKADAALASLLASLASDDENALTTGRTRVRAERAKTHGWGLKTDDGSASRAEYDVASSATPGGGGPCANCPGDWKDVVFVGIGPHNQSDLCGLVDTCASEVASCDFTQPPDEVFATCKQLKTTASPKPALRRFKGSVTGTAATTLFINQTAGKPGPFVLFIAPQFGGDYDTWPCYYVMSYLATQGIATFTATIPDPADANRDNWNRVPSAGALPYPYLCSQLDLEGPGCDNSSHGGTAAFLHDRHVEDVIAYAQSLGYSANQSVWWGYSEGAAMASNHLNFLLQRNRSAHLPKAMVMESNGGQYCYAFRVRTTLVR